MPFNKEQQMAIDADVNQNILISAGAGSGKTKTLTEKVFKLIDEGKILPSQLLVLTFTNNAAHEMKTRIINRFNKDSVNGKKENPHAKEMLSAHVQTMDSFNQYLVTKYSARLGISSNISVADESIIKSKKNKLLDEVFEELYREPSERKLLVEYLNHNALRDDGTLKDVVLNVHKALEGLLPSDKRQFINNYKDVFVTEGKLWESYNKLCNKIKDNLIINLYKGYFVSEHFNSFFDPATGNFRYRDISVINQIFNNTKFFEKDYHYLPFEDDMEDAKAYYDDIVKLIDEDNCTFFGRYKEISAKHTKRGKGKKEPKVLKALKGTLYYNGINLDFIKKFPNTYEEHIELVLSTQKDIEFIMSLVDRLDKKLDDYKRTTNFFTFNDIALMALSLFTDEQYKDIADEIRSRFKFIMVDEYQDTNDFQEKFINSLLVPVPGENEAHLFCVGDAKQAIYAFRNSNVELFRKRQYEYDGCDDGSKKVIHMNKNYRSTEALLHDINYIFKAYMTLENGDIDYKDKKEQLMYDKEVDIYGGFKEGAGIYRLVPETFRYNKEDEKTIEILTIIKDIKDKIASGYKVFDREISQTKEQKEKGIYPQIRPCRYGDFAILLRNKKSFKLYQKLFNENGLPLNNKVGASLREVDSIIVIETLCNLLEYESGIKKDADIKHLYASLARSYLFRDSSDEDADSKLFLNLNKTEEELKKDPILVQVHEFYERNKNLSFKEIYLNLLNDFEIVKKLYLVGNVDDNIAKIESLYNLILTTSKAGEGLEDFVTLFKDLKKYNLDIEDESVSSTANAVDLMTIHASKGLERKVIYMPSSENKIAKGMPSGVDLDFMSDYGIYIPHFDLNNIYDTQTAYNFLHYYYLNSDAKHINQDEHVRLLYVALTRAENTLIFVGSETSKKGSVYDIYENCPHIEFLNGDLVRKFTKPVEVPKEIKETFLSLRRGGEKESKYNLGTECKDIYLDYFEQGLNGLISEEEYKEYLSFKNVYFKDSYKIDRSMFKELEINDRKVDLYNVYNSVFDSFHKIAAEEALWNIQRNFNDKISTFYLSYFYVLCNTENTDKSIIDIFKIFSSINKDLGIESIDEIASNRDKILSKLTEKSIESEELIEEDLDEENEIDTDENTSNSNDDFEIVSLDFNKVICSNNPKREINNQVIGLLNYFISIKDKICSTKSKGVKQNEYATELISKFAYYLDNIKVVTKLALETSEYKDRVTYYNSDEVCVGLKDMVKPELERIPQSNINNDEISFDVKVKKRASMMSLKDEDNNIDEILKRGVKLHRYLELMDFETFDTSFIKDDNDRRIISNILKNPLMQQLKGAKVYKEYGYYDTELNTTGFIDLLFVKDGIYTIVDYKTSSIDKDEYEDQLKTYRRNVCRNFNIDESSVRMYLLSISKSDIKEIK